MRTCVTRRTNADTCDYCLLSTRVRWSGMHLSIHTYVYMLCCFTLFACYAKRPTHNFAVYRATFARQ